MNAIENWQESSEIFNDAYELPPTERPAFLERACNGDAELRHKIERMIADEEADDGFLDRPVVDLYDRAADEDAQIGRRIGPYEIVRRIAEGGMGAVFLARRTGGDIEKDVAVKLLRPGRETDDLLRRFFAERQLLARLEHPNVVQLHDVGTTDDGLPYMIMEHVAGERIDRYCDEHRLAVDERVTIFRQLCDAVAFVHRNAVIHRDIKPSNVLVTEVDGQPRVKLLDFGVAKLLRRDEIDDPRRDITSTRQLAPMTRRYASPEQQTPGKPVSTASDVYSLGALLYELLSGHPAHVFKDGDLTEALRVISNERPSNPSTISTRPFEKDTGDSSTLITPDEIAERRRTDPRRLRRALAGDLDNIVLRALRKEPERRFASARELSEDLERYLQRLPILSRSDTWTYRANKFVRRRPLVAAFVVLIAAATIVTVIQSVEIRRKSAEIRRQNALIVQERDRARESLRLFTDVFSAHDPHRARGETPDLREILDTAAIRLQSTESKQPDIQASLLHTIGIVYLGLGLSEDARPPLEKALQIRRSLPSVHRADLANSLHDLGHLEQLERHYELAVELMNEGIELQRLAYPEGHRELARGQSNLASVLRKLGRHDEATALTREALAMKVSVGGEDDVDVATSLNLLGHLMKEAGEYLEAEKLYRRAITIRRSAEGDDDPTLAIYLNSLAVLLVEHLDRAEDALTVQREALKIRRKVYAGMDHLDLMNMMNSLAVTLTILGQLDEAVELFDDALAMAGRLDSMHPGKDILYKKNKAMLLAERGDFTACLRLTEEALVREEREDRVGEAKSIRGACLVGLGRSEEAEPLLRNGYETLRRILGEDVRRTRQARARLEAFEGQ